MRFRDHEITFRLGNEDNEEVLKNRIRQNEYPKMRLRREERGNFEMEVEGGD